MTRRELVQKYKDLHEQASERSVEWSCYGEGFGFLEKGAPLDWVVGELQKRRMVLLDASVNNGYAHDAQYGTYNHYCHLRIKGLDQIIAEIEQLKEREKNESTEQEA